MSRLRSAGGQSTTETMAMMSFLLLMIFGLVHFCLLSATKSIVNLAAFAAARTMMVQDFTAPISPPTPSPGGRPIEAVVFGQGIDGCESSGVARRVPDGEPLRGLMARLASLDPTPVAHAQGQGTAAGGAVGGGAPRGGAGAGAPTRTGGGGFYQGQYYQFYERPDPFAGASPSTTGTTGYAGGGYGGARRCV